MTTNVSLPPALERFARQCVADGRYSDVSEVVRTGLRLLQEYEEQQRRFDAFRHHFNHERPHEALDQTPPADHYAPSSRSMPERLEDPWYDADHQVRRIRSSGEIKWRGERVFIGEALVGELVGIAPHDEDLHIVRFCGVDLGVIDHKHRFRRFAPLRHGLREASEPTDDQKVSTISPVQSVEDHPG